MQDALSILAFDVDGRSLPRHAAKPLPPEDVGDAQLLDERRFPLPALSREQADVIQRVPIRHGVFQFGHWLRVPLPDRTRLRPGAIGLGCFDLRQKIIPSVPALFPIREVAVLGKITECDDANIGYDASKGYGHLDRVRTASGIVVLHDGNALAAGERPYRPQTNGKVERLWRTLDDDVIDGATFDDLDHFANELFEYLVYYNNHRPHQALAGQTPKAFAATKTTATQSAN
jgi:hypothetical protein